MEYDSVSKILENKKIKKVTEKSHRSPKKLFLKKALATHKGKEEIVKILVENTQMTTLNDKDNYQNKHRTALQYAHERNYMSIADYLRAKGATT